MTGPTPACWTAGCDDDAEWDVALYNRWPNNERPTLPIHARCRVHASQIRDWWIAKHRGMYVLFSVKQRTDW